MVPGSFTQLTVKFPVNRERYLKALESISGRDKIKYKTQADYITAAVLYFEENFADETVALKKIYEKVEEISEKVGELCDEKKKE